MGTKPNFYELVYQLTAIIPKGRVCTYGDIAAAIGSKGAAQMVGWALNALNKKGNPKNIPAHRVVNRKGLLSGKQHFMGIPMQSLLEKEEIIVKNNQIQNFEKIKWVPLKDIDI